LALGVIASGIFASILIVIPFFDGLQAGEFGDVDGLAVDQQGNVYALDWWNNRMQKFDANGNYLSTLRTDAFALTVDKQGNIYTTEPYSDTLTKYSSSGLILNQWGTTRPGPRQFINEGDIALDSHGNIFVADLADGTMKIYSSQGEQLSEWNKYGPLSINSTVFYPQSIAIDSTDNLYILGTFVNTAHEAQYSEVEKYKINSDAPCDDKVADHVCFIAKWRSPIANRIAVDTNDYIYLGTGSGVKKFTNGGILVKQFGPVQTEHRTYDYFHFGDIEIGRNDDVYISDLNCGWIVKYTNDGNYLAHWGETVHRGGLTPSTGISPCD
jgi:tripartite motif-containing protein 71